MNKDYFKPDCPYEKECTSKGIKCNSCKHNKKKDYYEPKPPIYISPTIAPVIPYSPTVTCVTQWGGY